MARKKAPPPQPPISDPEAHAVLIQAMADVGADPAFVYAFRKTGIYVCEENEARSPKSKLAEFDAAVEEYRVKLSGPVQ